VAVRDAVATKAAETAGEGRFMGHAVPIVAFWSIVGTAVGAGLGAAISHYRAVQDVGLIIQMMSWEISRTC
jgi:uncharacterized membrane protein